MNFEFMTIDTPLPPCMPFPRALTGFPVSSTAKVMYCRMLDAMLSKGQEDENGILFVCFPVTAIAAVLSRSPMTVKRSLNELGAIIHHPEVGALRSPKAPRRRAVIFRSHGLLQVIQGTLCFPCAGCRQLPFCGLAIWGHLALQAVPSRQVS